MKKIGKVTASMTIRYNIECPNGHVYTISQAAYDRLKAATHGREANDVFEGFASHVPASDRGGVWQSI